MIRRGVMASVRRQVVRETEGRVADAYADLAVEERRLERRRYGLRGYLRRGGPGWSSRCGWAQLTVAEAERRVMAARSRLAATLAELNVVCGGG